MSALSDANDAIYGDDNFAVDADWRLGGTGGPVPVRIIRSAPDRKVPMGRSTLSVGTQQLQVRQSQVASPQANDTATLAGGLVLKIIGAPMIDDDGLNFDCEAVIVP